MELQQRASSMIARRLWKIVKIAFVMIRKGLMSRRNFINDMINGARDRKLVRESLRSLSFNHYSHSRNIRRLGLNRYEYEFSCSNSPNPVIVHSAKNKTQRFLPCMRHPKVIEDFVQDEPVYSETVFFVAKTPEYTFNIQIERCSPLKSPYSVRVSNYSNYSDDEGDGKYGQVDHKAEEFIRRFYDQLTNQIGH